MLQDVLQTTVLNNTVSDYLLALAILGISLLAINVVRSIVIQRLKRWSKRTETDLDDRLIHLTEQPVVFLLYLGAIYVSLINLELHPILERVGDVLMVFLTTLLTIRLLGSLIEYGIRIYCVTRSHDPQLQQSLNALVPAAKVVLWALGVVFLLDNLGFDISAVIAGLGIGGVAIALASQGVLQDLFSYFSILFDRPFKIGDLIMVSEFIGTVENVGIKTTRIRSLSGEELVMANTDLTGSRIKNFKRMYRRRIVFSLRVTYETGLSKIKEIPELIKSIIEATDNVTFDRAHFSAYGESSLNFEVVYFVETSDYLIYMDAQQHINLEIKAAFEARGIQFAYPTQMLYFANTSQTSNGGNGNGHSIPDQAIADGGHSITG